MNKWRIKSDGDKFEQYYWPRLETTFSNYESFWSEFITPMTCRNDLPRNHPFWIQFRQNVDADLQNIAMAHYTIFRCLAANWNIIILSSDNTFTDLYRALDAERFDMFYTNLGSIIDMVSNIFFFFAKLQSRFGLRKELVSKKSNLELKKLFDNFINKEYESRIRDFLEKRRPVHIIIHERKDSVSNILGDTSEARSFIGFSEKIKKIRNAAIHNPVIGTFQRKTRVGQIVPMVPKSEKLHKYYLWGNLFYNYDFADFVEREKTFNFDFNEANAIFNRLWGELIPKFRELTQVEGYEQLLGQVPDFSTK